MSQQSIEQFGAAVTALGTAASANAGVLVGPISAAAIGGGAGFLVSDFVATTVQTVFNLKGKTGVAVGLLSKGTVGAGLLGVGWKMTKLGALGKIGFFAAGAGCFISAVVDAVKYFVPMDEWGLAFGNKIRGWLGWAAAAAEGSDRLTRAEYERLLSEQRANPGNGGAETIRL